jgi:phage-related protein
MRPCLEDLLQLLVQEFCFDAVPGAIEAIEEAARALAEEHGYKVTPPVSGTPSVRFERLRRW